MPDTEPQAQDRSEKATGEVDYERLPNVSEVTISDDRGIAHSAFVTEARPNPEQAIDGKIPGVLMIGGIARDTENKKTVSPFTPAFGRYAQGLGRAGVDSLVMNPAGIGHSEGDTKQESIETRIDGWVQAAHYLVTHTNTDPNRIRLVGNSMGGHIALRVMERLAAEGITVDRVALISPYFYQAENEGVTYGNKYQDLPDHSRSPAYQILQGYRGRLLVSFVKNDAPIKPEIQDLANKELQRAIDENRGVGYGLTSVDHNYRPVDDSPQAHADSTKTLDQASHEVVDFLSGS